jgi:sulfur-oxidizing protein SoxZ
MADPMRIRALEQAGITEVKVLMRHDMETGLRKDSAGKIVPAHFIQNVVVKHKDRIVLDAQFGTSVAKDPFLGFKFKGGAKGDKIAVTWVDSKGDRRTDETVIS